jgi:hypothetical protein
LVVNGALAEDLLADHRNADHVVKGPPAAVSPYLKIMDRAVLLMARLGAEMGFSPTSRAARGAGAIHG